MHGSAELRQLMAAIAEGDKTALADLYDRTSAKVFGTVLRLVGERTHAEEIVQQVYLKIWDKAANYTPARGSVIAWMCAVARNAAIDFLRREDRNRAPSDWQPEFEDPSPTAADLAEQADDERLLAECMDGLEETSRSALRSAFFDGHSYAELARRAAVPLGTMKSRMRRSLLRLRECLDA